MGQCNLLMRSGVGSNVDDDCHHGDDDGDIFCRPEWDDVICRKLQPFICQLPAQVASL